MNALRKSNVELINLIDHINRVKNRNLDKYGIVEVRSALIPSGNTGNPENLLTIVKIGSDVSISRRELPYQSLVLFEETIPLRSFIERLNKVHQEKKFMIKDSIVGPSLAVQVNDTGGYFLESSGNVYAGKFPCYVYELRCISRPNVSGGEPLLSPILPYYESSDDALRDWFKLKPIPGMSDGNILIVIPVFQGYLGELKFIDKILKVPVEGDLAGTSYRVSGAWISSKGGDYRHFTHSVDPNNGVVDILRPNGMDKVVLWLNASDFQDPVDHFYESENRCSRAERVLYPPVASLSGESTPEDMSDKEIRGGENENVEFKAFILEGDTKLGEIVKTAIAFANTRGGRMYVGVNDYIEIKGVEREVLGMYRRDGIVNLDDAVKRYCNFIRKTLNDRSSRYLEAEVQPVKISGQTVVKISVPEGRDKPYCDSRTNEVWVRRGSNTVRPDPDLLLVLLKKENHGPLSWTEE